MASFVHDATVRHSLCVAHGEWVHEAEPSHQVATAHAHDSAVPQLRPVPQGPEESHEHCAVVNVTRGTRWLQPSTPFAISRPALDVVRELAPEAAPVREVRIRATPARGPPSCA